MTAVDNLPWVKNSDIINIHYYFEMYIDIIIFSIDQKHTQYYKGEIYASILPPYAYLFFGVLSETTYSIEYPARVYAVMA